MCCRYFVEKHTSFELFLRLQQLNKENISNPTQFNSFDGAIGEIYPSNQSTLFFCNKTLHTKIHKWGFPLLHKNSLLLNARFESLYKKPMFRNTQRCLIPANAFFEWKKEGSLSIKYKISVLNEEKTSMPFFMPGLCKDNAYVVITMPAVKTMQTIHHRMPVILNEVGGLLWLQDRSPVCTDLFSGELHIQNVSPPENQQLCFI